MFLTKRFYIVCIVIILLLGLGYLFITFFYMGQLLLLALLLTVGFDIWLLYKKKNGITCSRNVPERFSNGDDNPVRLYLDNHYSFPVELEIVDEIPVIFQDRNIRFDLTLKSKESKTLVYKVHPTKRGVYDFGRVRIFTKNKIGLVSRRYSLGVPQFVKVYPSYLMLHQYELMAMSNNLSELGIKKIRKIGHHTEFEHIKEYVKGDDYRTINWKASARRHNLMVNVYQDERSQQIYSVIDKGRLMQSAFNGMTLLDYAINASLVISYVAIHRDDKAGLATFEEKFETFIPASKQSGQMQNILESLYKQHTTFGESDYSSLYVHLNKYISKRSLLIIYTNFDSLTGMERQLNYLRQLARQHVVLVVFFENTELNELSLRKPHSTEEYFKQVVAEKFVFEKRLVVSKLKQYGVYSLLTNPEDLSVNVINKYLELKSKRVI